MACKMATLPVTPPSSGKRRLPIGLQTLRELRESGCYYVDKSGMAVDLIESGKAYFLSRPRRFGKSLLIDTFKALFEGHRALFEGLAAETRWDWTRRYPVIRLSFAGGELHSRAELDQRIGELLDEPIEQHGVTLHSQSLGGRFHELIRRIHRQTGERVVVLIDEYDKPILDNLTNRDVAQAMREGLRNLYSVLKDADEHLTFVFLTGVSKFSKVSLFSGLNHLRDITLDPRYSALCGYTDEDVDTVFAPELPGLDRDEIRRWYNGYNWRGTGVYNPFDLLLLFDLREFRPYWFETGTPTFLVNLLVERRMHTPELGRLVASESLLSTFDVDTISPEALLFQAGYLTIGETEVLPGMLSFTLKYPNQEVQASLNGSLLKHLVGDASVPEPQVTRLWRVLKAGDPLALRELFHAFFASIPSDWYRNSPIAQFEGYWASVFYSHFAALGLDIRVEDTTNKGRIDMVVLACGAVWVFEFKVVELVPQGRAIEQIRQRGYAEKYRGRGEPVHLIGVEFSRVGRNVAGFEVETIGP
jgi:Predicted AAA-ATPase/PD-(D/E)XK nuclease superfamily